VSIADALNDLWNTILGITSQFVIPDWNAVIGLLPILIFLGVIGPLLTLLPLGILIYQFRKPRVKVALIEGARIAETGTDGQPIFPPGLPFCRRHGLIHPSGAHRCDRDGEELAVTCPMCGLGRSAMIDTCSNCGLVLNVKRRPVPVRPAGGPRPGGAAVA
jgi:hypothetical protein